MGVVGEQEEVSEWKPTEFESIEKAILIGRRLGLPVTPVEPRPKGLVAVHIGDFIVAQPVEGGPVKQKRLKPEAPSSPSVESYPRPSKSIGYGGFFVGSWKWSPTGDSSMGAILARGEYRAYLVGEPAHIFEVLETGDGFFSRMILPSDRYRGKGKSLDEISEEFLESLSQAKGGGA